MHHVTFQDVEVFTSQTDLEAINFAVSLHQASNVTHVIRVFSPDDIEYVTLNKS